MRAIVGGVIGFLSASTVWLVVMGVRGDAAAPPIDEQRALVAAVADLTGQVGQLAESVAVLGQGAPLASSAVAPATWESPERHPLVEGHDSVVAELQAMRRDLQRLGRSRGVASAEGLSAAAVPTRLDHARAFHAICVGDRDAARSDVLLLSRAEVLARFGKPTHAWVGQARELRWAYRIGERAQFSLSFHDGIVVDVGFSTDS